MTCANSCKNKKRKRILLVFFFLLLGEPFPDTSKVAFFLSLLFLLSYLYLLRKKEKMGKERKSTSSSQRRVSVRTSLVFRDCELAARVETYGVNCFFDQVLNIVIVL